jgi:hypothetical protein
MQCLGFEKLYKPSTIKIVSAGRNIEIMEPSLWISGLAASVVVVITVVMEVIRFVWWKPLKIQKHFESRE